MSDRAQHPATTGAGASGGLGKRIGAELTLRTAAALALMAVALIAAWAGGFWFLACWLLGAALVLWEWQKLIGGERLLARLAVGALTLLAAAPFALHGSASSISAPTKVLIATPEATLILPGVTISSFAVVATTLVVGAVVTGLVADGDWRARLWSGAGVLYAGALMASPVLLRASPAYGLAAILWLFAVVWATDSMAYFGGRLIGGPKLWPRVSPGKTWAGALVGAAAGALVGALVGVLAAPSSVRFAPFLALGFAASIATQLGDLLESAVKRRFGAKDSSRLIPGHGGMMDRLDGFVAAATFAALVAWARSSGAWIAGGLFQW